MSLFFLQKLAKNQQNKYMLLNNLNKRPKIRKGAYTSQPTAEVLGYTYRRQVPLPRIPNNQAQDSTRDAAHPYVQTFVLYGQANLGQWKPEELFIQIQRHTDVINSYTNICK